MCMYVCMYVRMSCMQSRCVSYSCCLSAGVSAIPGAPSPIESDGNAAPDAITIRWSAVMFTPSPVMYNVAYKLNRTNDSVESGSELVNH